MEVEWAQVLLGAIGGGGIVGVITQYWIFKTQFREERRERARARLQQLTLGPEFMRTLAAMTRIAFLMEKEVTKDELEKAIELYREAMNTPMSSAVMYFLPDTISIRFYKVTNLLEAMDLKAARIELARLSDDFKETLGLDVLE
jgi:hypothetical protein